MTRFDQMVKFMPSGLVSSYKDNLFIKNFNELVCNIEFSISFYKFLMPLNPHFQISNLIFLYVGSDKMFKILK